MSTNRSWYSHMLGEDSAENKSDAYIDAYNGPTYEIEDSEDQVSGCLVFVFAVVFVILSIVSRGSGDDISSAATRDNRDILRIVAGSGFSSFEPILMRWGKENHVDVQISYKGSLDIMMMLEDGNIAADAIWEGDSLWTSLGDKQHVVKDSKSIMCSPIVFGVKKSLAQELGWIGRDVGMQEILNAAEDRRLQVLMTSATQSNSGASAYFGFLYAFAGQPDVLTAEHLQDPELRDRGQANPGHD